MIMLGILHLCGHAHVRSHVSPGMDCVMFQKFHSRASARAEFNKAKMRLPNIGKQ